MMLTERSGSEHLRKKKKRRGREKMGKIEIKREKVRSEQNERKNDNCLTTRIIADDMMSK